MGDAKRRKAEIEAIKDRGKRKIAIQREQARLDMRDAALRSLDPGKLERWLLFWNHPVPFPLARPDVYYAMMHKARLQLPDRFTLEERIVSAQWLLDNNDEYQLPAGVEVEFNDKGKVLGIREKE